VTEKQRRVSGAHVQNDDIVGGFAEVDLFDVVRSITAQQLPKVVFTLLFSAGDITPRFGAGHDARRVICRGRHDRCRVQVEEHLCGEQEKDEEDGYAGSGGDDAGAPLVNARFGRPDSRSCWTHR
jgi:hypothetical protein